MAIRGDSYGSVDGVAAFTKHLLDGEEDYSPGTVPTKIEVESFIDRASGILNNVIIGKGVLPANVKANSTAKLALDDWVINYATRQVELTKAGGGWEDNEGSRLDGFSVKDADEYIEMLMKGWKELGIVVTEAASVGLHFTGLDPHKDRADPGNTSIEQPLFRRHKFDNLVNADNTGQ